MNFSTRRIISILLATMILLMNFGIVYAENGIDGATEWVFYPETRELQIFGEGNMLEFNDSWYEYDVEILTIQGNFTSIDIGAFENFYSLRVVQIDAPVEEIRSMAFLNCDNLEFVFFPRELRYVECDVFSHHLNRENVTFCYSGSMREWRNVDVQDELLFNSNVKLRSELDVYFECDTEYNFGEYIRVNVIAIVDGMECFFDRCSVYEYDKYYAGHQNVILRFGPFIESVDVYVNDENPDVPVDEYEIQMNVKTEYFFGEEFYAEIYVYTADGVCYQVEDYVVEGFDGTKPGNQTVMLIYECDNGITYTETFEVVVYENDDINSSTDEPGTEKNPYLIETEEDLFAIANGEFENAMSSCYELQNDIIMTSSWIPFGTFSGSFDGNGYAIYGINIIDKRNYTGFFGYNQGTIKNLTVYSNISTTDAYNYYGGLAAYNTGTISNCHAVVDINVSCSCNVNHNIRVGGITGENHGTIKNCSVTQSSIITKGTGKFASPNTGGIAGWNFYDSVISSCYFSGTVTGEMTGGITGWNYELIERCHSDGSVTNSDDAGGIVGHNSGNIKYSYSSCTVSGTSYAGGLVGLERGGSIYHCYSIGYVEGTSKVGAFTGNSSVNENTTSSYYNSETCGCSTGGVATPLTAKEMKTMSSYSDWDFENVWDMSSKVNDGYPYLRETTTEDDGSNEEVLFKNVKTEYEYGEEFYIEVYVYGDDGSCYKVEDYKVEGFDSYTPGNQDVTVTYNDYSEIFYVTVKEAIIETEPTYELVIENVKTEYEYGEKFYAEVYVYGDDGSCYRVEEYVVEGFDSYFPGKQTVTLRYEDWFEVVRVTVYDQPAVEPENAPVISVSTAKVRAGNTVDVVVSISNNTGFANLALEIEYDSALTLVGVEENKNVGATFTAAQSLNTYPYNIGFDAISGTDYNGELVVLTFEIPEGTEPGCYFVNVGHYRGRDGNYIDGYDVNYDLNENPLGLNYENGCINVFNTSITRPEQNLENTYNGNVYMVLEEKVSWLEAKALCEEAGGHLATITSAKENDFVKTLCSDRNETLYYLGATDIYSEDMWSWINGENFVYSNWTKGEPDNAENDGSYLVMHSDSGKWSSESSYDISGIGFICEWEGDSSEKESVYWVEFVSQKEIYATGEEFDVQVWLYTDDSALRIYDDYTVSGFDNSKPGWCNVTVSFGEYSQTFEVEVVDAQETVPVITYVVQSVATEGVSISPNGYSTVNEGTAMKFVVGVEEGYNIDNVTVNGEPVKLADSNLSVIITKDTVIEVTGKKKTYLIESNAVGNGNVELSSKTVEHGGNCSARIIADDGYIISDVKVDGKSVGVCKYYTFTDIKENHSITATFEKVIETFTVKATAGTGGKISPAQSVINSGNSAVFTITPDYGYHVAYAVVNDEINSVSSDKIVLEHVSDNTNVSVVFEKDIYEVSTNSSEGAQIYAVYNGDTGDSLYVPYMEMADIVIEVEEGYKLNTLYVNNIPVKPKKLENKLVYSFSVTKNTVVSARCIQARTSVFNQQVSQAGLAADINANNAYQKKAEFLALAEQYTMLSEDEKVVCTSAYASVLAALDRANAYIALIESDIIGEITALPKLDELSADNFREWKGIIDNIYIKNENLTYLSKSLIDYAYTSKLSQLKSKAEMFDRESKNIISYLYECIETVPYGENINADSLFETYSKLMLAEDTYQNLSKDNKKLVSDDMYNKLFDKHGRISTQIHKLYVTPFTSKVLRCSGVNATDSVEIAEAKRVQIYDLMNEYHKLPSFVQEQISDSTVQKINSLYENASIKVSTAVNDMPIDMNGDFNEDVDLVLTEPDIDSNEITATTGKTVYQAIDVKMYSDEQEIQPSSKIRIKMGISEELSMADVSVIYIDNNDVVYDVQGEVIEEEGKYYIVFFVDHFSSFAVIYNESTASEPVINFDAEYAEVGDYITATVSGMINTANCNLFIAGYSKSGAVTFVEMGDSSVSATIAEDTEIIKAFLWDKNMNPIIDYELMSVDQFTIS